MSALHPPRHMHRQSGAVMLVALIFLVMLTLLAIGASTNSLLQEHMVAATRNSQLALMGGDTALRGAEWHIWSSTAVVGGYMDCPNAGISSSDGCVHYDLNSPPYLANGDVTKFRTSTQWLTGIGVSYTGADSKGYTSGWGTADLAQNPQYLIDDLGLERPPGGGSQHESGATGPNNGGAGNTALHIFRITARATGGNQNTIRVLQSTFDAQASN